MIAFVSIIHALACVFIVIFILLQDPKGGVLGTLGGGGGSRSFFGSEGASPFLVSVTKWLAILFACSSFYLSYMSSQRGSVMDDLSAPITATPTKSSEKATSQNDTPEDSQSSPLNSQDSSTKKAQEDETSSSISTDQ